MSRQFEISDHSYEEVLEEVSTLAKDMRDAGIGTVGRIDQTINRMEELVRIAHHNAPIVENEAFYYAVLYEASELALLSKAWSTWGSAARSRLEAVSKGALFYASDEDTTPRNIAFELVVACMASRAGLHVELPTDGDVTVWFEGSRLLVECKRVRGTRKIQRHIKKASQQTEIRKATKNDIGLVVLDVSTLVNPDFRRIVAPSRHRFYRRLAIWNQAASQHESFELHRERALPHIGVVVRNSQFAVVGRNSMVRGQQWNIYTNPSTSVSTKDKLERFVSKLDPYVTTQFDFLARASS